MASTGQSVQHGFEKVGSAVEQAGERLQEGGARLRGKAGEVVQGVQQAGSDAARMAQEQFENLRGTAAEYYEKGRDRAQQMGEEIGHRIQDRPLQSILIAAGLGFLLGAIWTRR